MKIEKLKIENFKSIKNAQLDCKRVNVFIGEPNTGKSNILETLGLLSGLSNLDYDLDDFVRMDRYENLFHNEDWNAVIKIQVNEIPVKFEFDEYSLELTGTIGKSEILRKKVSGSGHQNKVKNFEDIKYYKFIKQDRYKDRTPHSLNHPYGNNLPTIVRANERVRDVAKNIFQRFGYRLVIKPQENKLEIQKEIEDIIISHPYTLVSDTLQRIIFYLAAIYSNKNSILVFEEPESHAFPYYTKFMAETIAQEKTNNQYFVSTHNPYFLLSLIEKIKTDEIAVFITHMEDFQTKVKRLDSEEMSYTLDKGIDIFFNIDKFVEKKYDIR